MRRLRAFLLRLVGMFRKQRRDREFSEEMESHLQMHIEDNMRAGMCPEEARRNVLLKLGGLEQTKEIYRDRRGLPLLETLFQDLRFGLRVLRKKPGFTAAAVLTLALGIGANSAIFSVVYAVLLRPLPLKDPDRLVSIEKQNPSRGWTRNSISAAEFLEWRKNSRAFANLAAFSGKTCVLTGAGDPEELPCETAESHLFPLLGVAPFRGRTFSPEEDQPGGTRVAILSYGLWQRRFGGDDNAIGKPLTINGTSYTVVGIMPASFTHVYTSPYRATPQMWLSGIGLSPASTWNDYFAVGRLKPGATLKQAAAEMDSVSVRLDAAFPAIRGWRAQLFTVREIASGDERQILLLLLGAVTFVLLIACANVANLMLTHGAARISEFAVRQALGASQIRLIRQLLTESLLISIGGGALGVLLASWGTRGLAALAPSYLLRSASGLASGAVDARVLAFTFVMALGTSLLFGLGPAIRSAKPDVNESLKETGRSSAQSIRSARVRGLLVTSEIALAIVLLAGAGLMIRTLAQLGSVNLGFHPENVLTMRVPLSGPHYKEPQAQVEFWQQLVASVATLPGVDSASVSRGLPVGHWAGQFFTTAQQPNPPAGQVPDANYVVVGADYFRALQIPLRRGRCFNEHDMQNSGRVVIVNEELARRTWPGEDPLGKQLRTGDGQSTAPWFSVVGVVGNVLSQGQSAGYHSEIYVPYQQYPWVLSPEHLVVRVGTSLDPAALTTATVQEIHRLDRNQPVADIAPLQEAAGELVAEEKMVMSLLGAFAGLALILSAVGTYSVLAYSVAQRTREIGVRMALGAQPKNVVRLVAGEGSKLVASGIAAGIVAALALTQLMTGLLYGVRAADPLTFTSVAILIAAVSAVACYIPARRAMRVDPIVALRYE